MSRYDIVCTDECSGVPPTDAFSWFNSGVSPLAEPTYAPLTEAVDPDAEPMR